MGESWNNAHPGELTLPLNYIYAQTFTPLWSHNLELLRYWIKPNILPGVTRMSLQRLNPDGTPTGADLFKQELRWWSIDPLIGYELVQAKTPSIRLVAGTQYALLLRTIFGVVGFTPTTRYVAPPGGYARGKLIRSTDNGLSWDLTDRGDLTFAEFGDPPRAPTHYAPSFLKFAITDISQINYRSNACIRIGSTVPSVLKCYVTDVKPKLINTFRLVRGRKISCFGYLSFNRWRSYDQKEACDSLYHTFFIGGLRKDKNYWMCFTGECDYFFATSTGPIIEREHPGGAPFIKTYRPDTPGDRCQLPAQTGDPCPNHYLNVDESPPDEDTTRVGAVWSATGWWTDLYNMPDPDPTDTAPIEKVRFSIRIKRHGGSATWRRARVAIFTHGVAWYSDNVPAWGTEYANWHLHLDRNPITGNKWTYAEIKDLQIGVRLGTYWGVSAASFMYCTQVYCRVYHECAAYN